MRCTVLAGSLTPSCSNRMLILRAPQSGHRLRSLPRTVLRTTTVFFQSRNPSFAITLAPHIPRWSRDFEFSTQLSQGFFSPADCHHEPHPLLTNIFHSPSHPCPLRRELVYSRPRSIRAGV